MKELRRAKHRHGRISLTYWVHEERGGRDIIVFHGFGQSHKVFTPFLDYAKPSDRIILFDLFFHGESQDMVTGFNAAQPLKTSEWLAFFESLTKSLGINKLHLIAYSMGARLILPLIHSISAHVLSVHLIAPDGFIENPWYRFATKTSLGRALFRLQVRQGGLMKAILSMASRTTWIDNKLIRISEENTSCKEKRLRLYHTWIFLREIGFDADMLAYQIENRIQIFCHIGTYDKLIPEEKVKTWPWVQKGLMSVYSYERGHNLLVDEVFGTVMRQINISHPS